MILVKALKRKRNWPHTTTNFEKLLLNMWLLTVAGQVDEKTGKTRVYFQITQEMLTAMASPDSERYTFRIATISTRTRVILAVHSTTFQFILAENLRRKVLANCGGVIKSAELDHQYTVGVT
jgi:hypothetical protein